MTIIQPRKETLLWIMCNLLPLYYGKTTNLRNLITKILRISDTMLRVVSFVGVFVAVHINGAKQI